MTDAEKEIREALAAGPTPGEWFAVNDGTRGEPFMNVKAERISGRGPTHEVAICATGDSPQSMETANARYIAACAPANMRELLAAHDALKADADRYRWLRGDSCPDHSSRWIEWEVRHWEAPFWTGDLRGGDLDAAIDAARSKEQK